MSQNFVELKDTLRGEMKASIMVIRQSYSDLYYYCLLKASMYFNRLSQRARKVFVSRVARGRSVPLLTRHLEQLPRESWLRDSLAIG